MSSTARPGTELGTVGVFHLVRKLNGVDPFRAFIRSLRAHLPTGDWRLILIFKGFTGAADAARYLAEADGLPRETIFISDAGYDISSYFQAAAATRYPTLAFFNSFSVLVAPRWFEHLTAQLARPGVGLVGATGSLESVVRNHVIYGGTARGLVTRGRKYALAAGLIALFPPFPNAHVRTNAFMVRRSDFLATRRFPVRHRLAALFYESGWLSLTRQLQARGLEVLVVDRDGRGLPPSGWADAATFRSGAQDRLFASDNRVRDYADATDERKQFLRTLAFGADPH